MLDKLDVKMLNDSIAKQVQILPMDLKARQDFLLSIGKCTIYNLGKQSNTIRIDIKLNGGNNNA